MWAAIIAGVPILVAFIAVVICFVREREDAPPVAFMESSGSHLDEGGAHRVTRAAKREARRR